MSLIANRQGIERGESGGRPLCEAIAALPELQAVPIEPAARLLHGAFLPGVPPRLSQRRQAQLEAAARRLDHYSGRPGAWIEIAVRVLECWAAGEMAWHLSEPPRSLGALALELRRIANDLRHRAICRRTERLRPVLEARRRAEIKRWRTDVRRLEREAGPHAGRSVRKPGRA